VQTWISIGPWRGPGGAQDGQKLGHVMAVDRTDIGEAQFFE
jgi:hypothetical protein